ncbi:MAG: SRPBCC family protein [Alphaproteobacteria bacterium]
MDMTGEFRLDAPPEVVWRALNDPEVLKQCIPGCETLTKNSDTEFVAEVRAKVGPVSARFTGKVSLTDLDPPNGYRISGEGQGGVAGFAKGGAEVKLVPDGAGTLLSYSANGQVGGKLAQIGSRLIDATARKMADDFFTRFADAVKGAATGATDGAGKAESGTPAPDQPLAAAAKRKGLSPLVWIAAVIAGIVIILAAFGR